MRTADLQLDWLRAFVAVVDAGSLTAAVPHVHRSPSALSMQLKKLEDAAGAPVLVRDPRHLELTHTGRELLGYARRLLELHDEALTALHGPTVTGRVTLGVPDDYAFAYLTPLLRAFGNRHPSVEICLVCEQSTLLIPKVQRGELDLAVVSRDRVERGTFLFREPVVWVGAMAYEIWRKDPLPIAVYETGSRARRDVIAALSGERRAYRIVYSSRSLVGLLAAVESGLAVAAITATAVPPQLQALGTEHGLPPLPDLDVAVIRGKASSRTPAANAMHEQVVRTLRRRT
ncbi:LysR substrate-binding domain-containing protein [Pendulispora albinea]|uniref:LysR substrate-binding domain-containing protein n=1 Tax=Pendulispora albinea TaxID=2741071 RepID=A0ABZ2LV48_9BACT